MAIWKYTEFLTAEKKEDFEKMAEEDTYINEAYEVLQKLSADEQKRLEYEARQKAIMDYNSQMSSSFNQGEKHGEARYKALCDYLLKDGRIEDLKKAVSDEIYTEKLYKEYGL